MAQQDGKFAKNAQNGYFEEALID